MLKQTADVKFEKAGGILTAHITGEIDHRGAVGIRNIIDGAAAKETVTHLVLDLSGVNFMDSSGLGLILGRYNTSKSMGIEFSVANPSSSAERILSAAGAERIIEITRHGTPVPQKEM